MPLKTMKPKDRGYSKIKKTNLFQGVIENHV